MINNKTIAVIVPCYNEETQIVQVLKTMPDFVDRIIVIDDKSSDSTSDMVKKYILDNPNSSFAIENILDKIKPNNYNRANILVQELQKEEIKYFSPIEIFNNNNSDRIVLIRHKNNSGKGAGIATGYKWAKDHGVDCVATMDGDGQMDPDELLQLFYY